MKKQISFSAQGKRADIGEHIIYRMMPNRYAEAVGPFVFLDHIAPALHTPDKPMMKAGTGAHPHRGIATLTYILDGEGEHYDSRGHHARVHSGGVQWMKAGNGIIHDETFNVDSRTGKLLVHGFQFWINLPSKIKTETPEYLSIQADEVPQYILSEQRGWLKVIAGEYENLNSKIPAYSKQFIYHLHLAAGRLFSIGINQGMESAILLPQHPAVINDTAFNAGDFIEFDREEGTIAISNNTEAAIDLIVFGGEKYTEPIAAGGPFVMNSQSEIATAYKDFYAGKYGEINYDKVQNNF